MVKLGLTVIQLKSGITVETIEADEDYRTGRIAAKVANRVKVAWDGTNEYIYVNADELVKADSSTLIYAVPLNSGIPDSAGEADNADKPVKTARVRKVGNADIAGKPLNQA